ncbi:MAG: chloride channel protein [Planctomycetia bacterium]
MSKFRSIFDLEGSGRLLIYSVIVGVVAGLGGVAFYTVLEAFQHVVFSEQVMDYHPPTEGEPFLAEGNIPSGQDTKVTEDTKKPPSDQDAEIAEDVSKEGGRWWIMLLVPTAGGLVCGFLVYTFAPEAEGHGTDGVIRAFHSAKGIIRARVPLVKSIASIITIGTGGSAGREGPIAQIGAGFGSILATRLKLSDRERRMLVMAGAAGGISAIFHAPVGGALFAIEVLYASTAVEFMAFVPCVCSSVVAYSVFNAICGDSSAFVVRKTLTFEPITELPFYLVFAVICAICGFLYVSTFYGLRNKVFHKIHIPNHFKPAIGGLMLGTILIFYPEVMAGGYGWIQQAIDGNLTIQLMGVLVLVKIVATSCTISSGGSGGVFAPSLFIGAMLGGAYGMLCHAWFPELVPTPEAFVLVGMGGFFAGVAKVPLTALIMVSEMSSSYSLLVPLMLVSVINVAILSQKWTLYEEQVSSLVDSPAHFGDFVVDILAQMYVREVYNPGHPATMVHEGTPLPEVLRTVADSNDNYFPVVDDEKKLVGIFSLHDIRSTLTGNPAGGLILASDLARSPVTTITPDDNLHDVLRIYTQKQFVELPVVDPAEPDRVICMLPRGDVIAAYDRQISLHQAERRS